MWQSATARCAVHLKPMPGGGEAPVDDANESCADTDTAGPASSGASTSNQAEPSDANTTSPGRFAAGDRVTSPMSACTPVAGSLSPGAGESLARRYWHNANKTSAQQQHTLAAGDTRVGARAPETPGDDQAI